MGTEHQVLFSKIAADLRSHGYSLQKAALPADLARALRDEAANTKADEFREAGIGRSGDFQKNASVRSDEIRWINPDSQTCADWLDWADALKQTLNRQLFLGLFSFESHFAHYAPGAFYQRHVDAFRGQGNRVVSVVVYLNEIWQAEDGGAFVLYQDNDDTTGQQLLPELGTIAVFLSEEFPHEVLPASKDRYSIAGWFRVNTTVHGQIDPPT